MLIRRSAFIAIIALGAASLAAAAAPPVPQATITRTRYGIPHVVATDWVGLGFGTAYAFAQDNFCLLAEHLTTLAGERAKYFGADATVVVSFKDVRNIDSDAYYRGTFDDGALRSAVKSISTEYQELLRGYVAGYNRYLSKRGTTGLAAECRGASWVRPMTELDALRLNEDKMRLLSAEPLLTGIVGASPPTAEPERTASRGAAPADPFEGNNKVSYGSNGWAFGRDATGGAGVLLGNPHFPWETTNRFWQVHQTIPGKLDVMGVTLAGLPAVIIGFNRDVAWTHTVSTDRHLTLFELTLDPADPTVYVVDSERHKMDVVEVLLEVKNAPSVERRIYRSIYGPVVKLTALGLDWSRERAYAVKDADELNFRSADAWLAIARSRSVGEIRQAISQPVAIPWLNTIAVDRHGDAFYADVTPTPNVTSGTLASCGAPHAAPALAALRQYVLDGARATCDWARDPRSAQPGLLPASAMPQLVRRDFVANSNDSFWLVNDLAPIRDVPEIVGRVDEPQGLRTRAGLMVIHDALAARNTPDGGLVTPAMVEQMIFQNRNLAAELTLDDVLAACGETPDSVTSDGKPLNLAQACQALRGWDRRMNLDSHGAALWVEFWAALTKKPGTYPPAAVPFNAADPVHTPRGLDRSNGNDARIRAALADAVTLLTTRGVALDAPWGSVQNAVRGALHVPIHGGPGSNGVLNMQESEWQSGVGYVPVRGSSYMQVVTFDEQGPVADAVLSYSQSTEPTSPNYADQTQLYSKKAWNRLPFSSASIRAQTVSVERVR